MSARKIRMTSVGLVAMPADRDESTVTGDDLGSRGLATAFAELLPRLDEIEAATIDAARYAGTYEQADRVSAARDQIERWWDIALDEAAENNLEGLRAALQRARDAASAAGYSTEHEDAALAMLPPAAGRRAA